MPFPVPFLKVVDDKELIIPRPFVREYWNQMSNPISVRYLSQTWKANWKVNEDGDILITNWEEFLRLHSLKNGFLVFSYQSRYKSTLEVLMIFQEDEMERSSHQPFQEIPQKNKSALKKYIEQLPPEILQHVEDIVDVKGDGNCGFRVVATAIGKDEESWASVRNDLKQEFMSFPELYSQLFGTQGPALKETLSIDWNGDIAPEERWMVMPNMGYLIANKYNVVVIFLSLKGSSSTIFPLKGTPPALESQQVISIAHVNRSHYVKVVLRGNCPIPNTELQWQHQCDDEASNWENFYEHRMQAFAAEPLNPQPQADRDNNFDFSDTDEEHKEEEEHTDGEGTEEHKGEKNTIGVGVRENSQKESCGPKLIDPMEELEPKGKRKKPSTKLGTVEVPENNQKMRLRPRVIVSYAEGKRKNHSTKLGTAEVPKNSQKRRLRPRVIVSYAETSSPEKRNVKKKARCSKKQVSSARNRLSENEEVKNSAQVKNNQVSDNEEVENSAQVEETSSSLEVGSLGCRRGCGCDCRHCNCWRLRHH